MPWKHEILMSIIGLWRIKHLQTKLMDLLFYCKHDRRKFFQQNKKNKGPIWKYKKDKIYFVFGSPG